MEEAPPRTLSGSGDRVGPGRVGSVPTEKPRGTRLGGETVYSHSRLSCFEQCPRRFRYRYLDKLPVTAESIEAFVGKRVHAVLQRLYEFVSEGRIPPLPRVLDRFRRSWEEQYDPARVRIVRTGGAVEEYQRVGERCLQNFYRRHYPFDRDETLGIETHLRFSLDPGGRYRLQGFVDRLCRAPDGALEIRDYKTGRWVPRQEALDRDRQLALYQLGLGTRFGGASPVRLVWEYLQRNQLRVSTRSPEQLETLRQDTMALIDRVEVERDFAARPGALCAWCEFRELCPEGEREARARGARALPQAAAAGGDSQGGATPRGREPSATPPLQEKEQTAPMRPAEQLRLF